VLEALPERQLKCVRVSSERAAIISVSQLRAVGPQMAVFNWIRGSEIYAGKRPGKTIGRKVEMRKRERGKAKPRRANKVLKPNPPFVAANLTGHN
jgi:transposase